MKRNFIFALFLAFWLPATLVFSENRVFPLADSLAPEQFFDLLRKTRNLLDSLDRYQTGDPAVLPLRGFYLGSEQDIFNQFAKNEDRNYTMGLALGFLGPKTNRDYLVLPLLRRWATGLPRLFLPKNRREESIFNERKRAASIGTFDFRLGGFTPLHLERAEPQRDDRPYANPITLGFGLNRLVNPDSVRKRPWSVRSSLALGLLGSGVGRSFQRKVHREGWLGSTRPVPEGWHNQIANGGGVTALYALGLTTPLVRLGTRREERRWRVQTVATGELMAGMFTNAAVGLGFKAGYFQTPFWIGNDLSSRDISQDPTQLRKTPFGFFVYARPRLRFVAHNTLLTGQWLDFLGKPSPYTLSPGQVNRAVFEFEAGVSVKLRAWTLTFEPFSGRSPEFDTPLKRWHFWGTVHMALTLDKTDPAKAFLRAHRQWLDNAIRNGGSSGGGEEE